MIVFVQIKGCRCCHERGAVLSMTVELSTKVVDEIPLVSLWKSASCSVVVPVALLENITRRISGPSILCSDCKKVDARLISKTSVNGAKGLVEKIMWEIINAVDLTTKLIRCEYYT